jgi:hypothetical protein
MDQRLLMASQNRMMTLIAFLQAQNCSNLPGSWRHPSTMLDFLTPEYYQRIARTLEDGDRAHRKAGRGRAGCHRSFSRWQARPRAYLLGPSLGAVTSQSGEVAVTQQMSQCIL